MNRFPVKTSHAFFSILLLLVLGTICMSFMEMPIVTEKYFYSEQTDDCISPAGHAQLSTETVSTCSIYKEQQQSLPQLNLAMQQSAVALISKYIASCLQLIVINQLMHEVDINILHNDPDNIPVYSGVVPQGIGLTQTKKPHSPGPGIAKQYVQISGSGLLQIAQWEINKYLRFIAAWLYWPLST